MGNLAIGQPPRLTASSLWLVSRTDRPRLRIGLLLDDYNLPRFAASILEDIAASNFASIELVVLREATNLSPTPARSRFRAITRRLTDPELRKHFLHSLYLRYDRKKRSAEHPLDPIDFRSRLQPVDTISVAPIGKKFVHRFPAESIERIRQKDLDVLIRFGFGILKGDILNAARFGVWSYHHGDNEFYRGGPPHFWELYEGNPLSGVVLQVLTEELDAGLILAKSMFATRATIRVSENRVVPYWGSSDLIIRKLHDLHQYGWDHVRAQATSAVPYQGKRKLYRSPTNADMLRWLAPVYLKKAVRYPFREKKVLQWKLGVRSAATPLIEDSGANPLASFRWIDPPRGHFWADPFLLEREGRYWAFFEDYLYRNERAQIACAEVSANGELLEPLSCLAHAKYHYSYPYLVCDGNDLFLIPESYDSDTVDLFRCRKFPNEWEYDRTLLEGRFVDASIWRHEGLWWMLTTLADPHPMATRLLLFFAEKLGGEWHLHPASPISTDVRNNRGAGRIFLHQGQWIRPSQTAVPTYGYSFSYNRIDELSTQRYSETLIKTVSPETLTGFCGIHTYSAVRCLELIDGAMMRPAQDVLITD